MSLVNAFHVYSSRDLSRERKKERRLSEDPNLTRIVSIRTSTTEKDTRLFHQPSFPHSFLECYFLISSKKKKKNYSWKFSTRVLPHAFRMSNTFSYVERKWISRCDYTWIRSRRAITGLFARPFFFLIHTCFVHVNGLEKDSNTIDITRDKDQRFIFQHSFIIFLCREFDKKRIMARDNFPSHNGRQCFKNYFKINLAGEISRSLSLSCSDPRLYSDMLKRSCSNRPAINNFGVL